MTANPGSEQCCVFRERESALKDLGLQPASIHRQAAALLVEGFDHPQGWPTIEAATQEMQRVLRRGFAIAALEDELLLGWIGGLPEYDGRVWELHPLVVRRDHRLRGIGRALVGAFENEARRRGALTFTLGTDDDGGHTSLAGVDLYDDVPRHIVELEDLGSHHPFLFYRRLGYVVTGVMPDANGPGRPDIYMSKAASLSRFAGTCKDLITPEEVQADRRRRCTVGARRPVSGAHALAADLLPDIHRDPFDLDPRGSSADRGHHAGDDG